MKSFVENIETFTEHSDDFRRALDTGKNLHPVLMSIQPGEDIGEEVHEDRDQFFRVENGVGEMWIEDRHFGINSDNTVVVPAGARHNVVNTGNQPLRLYTLRAPKW